MTSLSLTEAFQALTESQREFTKQIIIDALQPYLAVDLIIGVCWLSDCCRTVLSDRYGYGTPKYWRAYKALNHFKAALWELESEGRVIRVKKGPGNPGVTLPAA